MKKYRLNNYVGDWAALVLAFAFLVWAIMILQNAQGYLIEAYTESRECREMEHWFNELGIKPEVPVEYDVGRWTVSYGEIQRNST